MVTKIITSEADTLLEAQNYLKSQIPQGYYVFYEEVITNSDVKKVEAWANTTDDAFSKARKDVPLNATILDEKEISSPEQTEITLEAMGENQAISLARTEASRKYSYLGVVKDVSVLVKSRKGFLGIRRKNGVYLAKLLRASKVEISYRQRCKISATLLDETSLVEELKNKSNSLQKRLTCYAILEQISNDSLDNFDIQELVESVATEIRHLMSRTYFQYEGEETITYFDPMGQSDLQSWDEVVSHYEEVSDPDIENIRLLISNLPGTLRNRVYSLSGEAQRYFDQHG